MFRAQVWMVLGALGMPFVASPQGSGTEWKYKILHSFNGGKEGGGLWGSLTLDSQGNLYGTATGTVFKLTPQPSGEWPLTILHSFNYQTGKAGSALDCTLIFDAEGNLYGSTTIGGGRGRAGGVFKLMPDGDEWKLDVLYLFGKENQADGPYAGVAMDPAGNLFGVGGSAFELSPEPGRWKETILHTFPAFRRDGWGTLAGVVLDTAGNIYGSTSHGGGSSRCDGGCGTIYQLSPQPDGTWQETILHAFQAEADGAFPGLGSLLVDASGNVYGTADGGSGYGVIFKLSPAAHGQWQDTILYSMRETGEGNHPSAGVVADKAGNFYGVTIAGGDPHCDCGVVYELSPGAGGQWTYTVLHRFDGADGAEPDANLIVDDQGNLYGTAATAGPGGYGVVFELTP
jgi:uncharacterized repeat protein (TIGR03803 family)